MDSKTTVDRFVGIDVAKNSLEVHVRPDKLVFSCGTDADSLAALAQRLKALQPKLIVLEATGGYESLLAAALVHAGLTVAIVNPRQTRQFAGAVGRLAKTDTIDAAMIAHFVEAIRPRPYVLADAQTQRLAVALMARRAPADGIHRCGRAATPQPGQRCRHAQILRDHVAQPEAGDRPHREVDRQADHRQSAVPRPSKICCGVFPVSVTWWRMHFIAELPELGTVDRHQIAALVGVAPLSRDGGHGSKGERHVYGGRPQIRAPLFTAAMAATRYNPALKAFYERLVAAGKNRRVALIAVMRKLVVIANAVLRDNRPWDAGKA